VPTGQYDRAAAKRRRGPWESNEDWIGKAILWSRREERDTASNYQQTSGPTVDYQWRQWSGPAIVLAMTDRSFVVRDAFEKEASEKIVVRDIHDFLAVHM
jgi:hypothetical protein